MILDSGVLYICDLRTDNQGQGLMPKQTLVKIARHWFGIRTAGITRQYLAKGANEQVDLLVRIHYDPNATPGRYAVTGNGQQFRILTAEIIQDDQTNLRYTDIALMRTGDLYDIER